MSCCDTYNHSFYRDIHNISGATQLGNFTKLQQLQSLFQPFNLAMSGIWQPAIIIPGQSSISYVDLFRRSEAFDTILDPCNCSNINENETPFEEQTLDCEYCNKTPPFNNSIDWTITDELTGKSSDTITSTYCKGANDVRSYPDDYLTKLPVLNNVHLTGLYDFKNLNQFPAVSNHNLGWDQFISIPVDTTIFRSFDASSAKLCIDWNICEKIGEIPPNDVDSYHKTIDDHEKSYNRHLNTTKTCGNFILLQPNIAYDDTAGYPRYTQLDNSIGKINNEQLTENQLPKPEFFTKPYGFKNQDFYNIFSSGNIKLGAHWKWNYSSGIICWYRYENIDMSAELDQRVFPGIDIYIPEGDVFFAKNDGPENPTDDSDGDIKSCPSGIKLVSANKTISAVIPGDSEFVYISENLYTKAYSVFYKLNELENQLNLDLSLRKTPKAKLELACILATSPNYDEITTDLLQKNPPEQTYLRNSYSQIDLFNTNMLRKPIDKSSNTLNLVKNKQDLFNTLVNKYGSYLWIPEHSQATISMRETQNPNISLNLDFQPVVNKNSIITNANASGQKDCNQNTILKEYYYDQIFSIGNNKLSTSKDSGFVNRSCTNGEFKATDSVITASVFHANSLVKSYAYSSGSINYDSVYLRPVSYDLALSIIGEAALCGGEISEDIAGYYISSPGAGLCSKSLSVKYNNTLDLWGTPSEFTEGQFRDDSVKLLRGYPASFFNPNIDLCGFHQDGGVYFDSNTFGANLVFNQFIKVSEAKSKLSFAFNTKDVGIKIYSINIENLRNKQNPDCKTLPLDQSCKCFPLKHINNYKYNCDGSLTYTNAGKILFTPNLSTHNSPDIKAYGGFSNEEITEIYNTSITIPNHISYGGTLPVLSKKIDPTNPYECSKSISLNLPNYTKTEWKLSLNKYITDQHTDVWATVFETNSILNINNNFFNPSDRTRYRNEVIINGKSFYNNQTNILSDAGSSVRALTIQIKNPFLLALLKTMDGEEENILYAPLPCSKDGAPNNLWLSDVGIVFHQQPRKQILMYQMHPLKSMGSLKPGFFHPNSGLQTTFKGETSLVFNKDKCYYDFDYERNLFQNSNQYSNSGSMYYANLTKKDQTVLDIISSLDSHKKLRLYIKSGSTWYEYLNPHIFGFYNQYNKNLYPGAAAYFEYTNYDKPKVLLDHTTPSSPTDTRNKIIITKPSPLIPASAKINIPFNYIVPSKILHPNKTTYFQFLDSFYPNIPNSFTRGFLDPNSIIIDSIRPYFFFEEESPQSYYDTNFSSLHFVFDENSINQSGIVKNSYVQVKPQTAILFDPKDQVFNTSVSHNIIAKYLLANIVDTNGNIPSSRVLDKKYIKISTGFVTESSLVYESGYIAFPQHNFRNAITIYQQQNSLYQEYSQLLSNRREKYATKWGDLVNYDFNSNPDLNDSIYVDSYIKTHYPFKNNLNRYANLADSLVLNQLSTGLNVFYYSYNLFTRSGEPEEIKNELINYNGTTNYVQHQKYSSDVDNLYEIHTDEYENFLSLFDIIFLDNNIKTSSLYASTTINAQNNIRTTGNIFISGLRQFSTTGLISYQDPPGVETISGPPLNMFANSIRPDHDSYMIVSLDNEAVIRPILFNRPFYYPTPRVDDTYFPLRGTEYLPKQEGSDCTTFFQPILSRPSNRETNYFDYDKFNQLSDTEKRIYFTYPIFCDSDITPDCGKNIFCRYKVAGSAELTAQYQHLEYSPSKFEDIAGGAYQYVLSSDEGLYNILHGDVAEFPYIQRFEIPPKDELFNQVSEGFFRQETYSVENRKVSPRYSYTDSLFQNQLSSYKNTAHTSLVSNTDKVANEMLFRLIHGAKQTINIETIKKRTIEDSLLSEEHKNAWTYLLQYSNIKTEPEKIYNLIPYDYSTQSDQSRRKVNGSISIEGVATLNTSFSASINNTNISFQILEIDGTVYLSVNHGDKTARTILGYTYFISESFFAVQEGTQDTPSAPDVNTSIVQVGRCDGGMTLNSWSNGSYFTEISFERKDADGNDEEIDVVGEFKKCIGKKRDINGCLLEDISDVDGSVIFVIPQGSFGGACFNCLGCNSRGYQDSIQILYPGCSVLTEQDRSISAGAGVGRGLFGICGGSCPSRYSLIGLTPSLRQGTWDGLVGGTPVSNVCWTHRCRAKSDPCTMPCNELNGTDKVGKIFDPIRIGANVIAPDFGGGEPCECRIPEYGYCSAARNSCDPCRPYRAINFTYNFKDSYSSFIGKGHVLRTTKFDPIQHDGIEIQSECSGASEIVSTGGKGRATEKCYWLECVGAKPPSYIIYKSTTKLRVDYEPLCPTSLAFIEYDNNVTKVSIQGQTSDVLCFDNRIRTDCPELSVTLPNNTFSFTDTIHSECSTCDVEPNKIDMNLQNPHWEIVTEERIAILGTISLRGNPNIDFFSDTVGGGFTHIGKGICSVRSEQNCFDRNYDIAGGGGVQCGKSAPDSWGWSTVLNCHLPGSPDPSLTACRGGYLAPPLVTPYPTLVNGAGNIGFATGSDNPTVRGRHETQWKTLMLQAYGDQQMCSNNASLIIDDIVEGVVPGSCGGLKFTVIGFPATAVRQTLEGGESKKITYGVDVAYYTYKYRRPKTIEDILLGENFLECKTKLSTAKADIFSHLSSHNMSEEYGVKFENCQTTPSCYDNTVDKCDQGNLCCKYAPSFVYNTQIR